ncbi:MAG: hypothetical protein Q4F53_01510 [Nesterenkonia sp.]|nr:hypothetical protein [Nesterenkonia sp.]
MSETTDHRPAEQLPSRRELRRRREAVESASDASEEPTAARSDQAGESVEAPEYSEDLRTLTSEIAAVSSGDPTDVDADLKRRQEAMAERARRENRARRELPPEEEAPDGAEDVAGPIAPVEASGAHGLDLGPMAEETSRSAARRNRLIILLLVVIVLLVVAVGLALFVPA